MRRRRGQIRRASTHRRQDREASFPGDALAFPQLSSSSPSPPAGCRSIGFGEKSHRIESCTHSASAFVPATTHRWSTQEAAGMRPSMVVVDSTAAPTFAVDQSIDSVWPFNSNYYKPRSNNHTILLVFAASAEEGYSVGFYWRQEESSYNWEAQFCWKLEEQKQKHALDLFGCHFLAVAAAAAVASSHGSRRGRRN
uniref:Uncharacterized protein n=1 Tax=Oryza nivara TaxID=4536 RepID=A0A0E0HU88_ORYNI